MPDFCSIPGDQEEWNDPRRSRGHLGIPLISSAVVGAYSGGEMLVTVVFSHNRFGREKAEQFLPLVTLFKSNTERLVAERRTFAKS